MKEFYRQTLKNASLPVFLYNFPRHTQFEITAAMAKELTASVPQICGVKDSSGRLESARAFREVGDGFQVFVGNDAFCLQVLRERLSGSITGAGNAFPECPIGICRCFEGGDVQNAAAFQALFDSWNGWRKALGADEVAITKLVLEMRLEGFPRFVRPPLSPLHAQQIEAVRTKVEEVEAEAAKLLSAQGQHKCSQ